MENILVPIDFSEVSQNALNYAIRLAEPLKCKIILFHDIYPVQTATDVGEYVYPYNLDTETKHVLNKKMDDLIEYVKSQNVSVDKIIHKGILTDDISGIVKNRKIDLIITGTGGTEGFDAFFFGTNSEHIFENVSCPVLILPDTTHFKGIKKIMYATDFQYGDIHEIENISRLAKVFNAQIIVTHVNSDTEKFVSEEESMNWLVEIASSQITYKNIIYKLISNKNVVEALGNSVKELDIDLLCMSTVKKNFFKKLFKKSNTKEMAFHATVPLMAIHLEKTNQLN
jgi:nucleotide-binding universal stress UspA family protein